MTKRQTRKPKAPVLSATPEQLQSWHDQLRVAGVAMLEFDHPLLGKQVFRIMAEMFGPQASSTSEK